MCVLCYDMHLCVSAADAMSNLLGLRARKQCVFVRMSDECVCVCVMLCYALVCEGGRRNVISIRLACPHTVSVCVYER